MEDVQELLRLRPGIFTTRTPAGETYLLTHRAGESLGNQPGAGAVLERLAAGPVPALELAGPAAALVARLRAGGWLSVTVASRKPLYTVVPHRGPPREEAGVAPERPVLSRFTVLRREGDALVLEHPDSWCRMVVHDAGVASAVGRLLLPAPASDVDDQLPAPVRGRLWRDLWRCGLAVPPEAPEDATLARRQWSPAERWLHQRSRLGDHHLELDRFAGTSWARGRFDPLPARHPPFSGQVTELRRPDLARLSASDPPLTRVLEERRSIREHDDAAPITVDQLAELLFRCGRNRALRSHDGLEHLSRPYPSGGALHELEIYPVVRHVAGLSPGLYHYDGQEHRLVAVCGLQPPVRRLLAGAARSAGVPEQPQVVLVVAARFGRIMWRYEQIGYSLVLKHVGVLYQVVYSVATAMGLAACGLGTGDSDSFAQATGLDPWEESSVGELMIGSRR